eukprot:g5140.t1
MAETSSEAAIADSGLTLADLNWVNPELQVGEGLLNQGDDMPPAPPVLPHKLRQRVATGQIANSIIYGDDGVYSDGSPTRSPIRGAAGAALRSKIPAFDGRGAAVAAEQCVASSPALASSPAISSSPMSGSDTSATRLRQEEDVALLDPAPRQPALPKKAKRGELGQRSSALAAAGAGLVADAPRQMADAAQGEREQLSKQEELDRAAEAQEQRRLRAIKRQQQKVLKEKQSEHLLELARRRQQDKARREEEEARVDAFRNKVKKSVLARAQASQAHCEVAPGVPHYLRETGATKRGKVNLVEAEEVTDEQREAAEQAKKERVSKVRRAFKAQTKKVLSDLQAKKKAKEAAEKEKEQEAGLRRERIKRHAEAARAKATQQRECREQVMKGDGDKQSIEQQPKQTGNKASAQAPGSSKSRLEQRKKSEVDGPGAEPLVKRRDSRTGTKAGSAAPAKSSSMDRGKSKIPAPVASAQIAAAGCDEGAASDGEEEMDEAAQKALEERKARHREFVRKQRAHLAKLVESRKAQSAAKDEQAAKKDAVRARVRQAAKQMQERVAERREMAVQARREGCIRDAADGQVRSAVPREGTNGDGRIDDSAAEASQVSNSRLSGIVQRLHEGGGKRSELPAARDFDAFRKRMGISRDVKVFSITGWYPVVKEDLLRRGWFHNTDRESPFWDFKWTMHSQDANNVTDESQFINHFGRNVAITTKNGLVRNLRSLVWHQNVDASAFFPRCYILNLDEDMFNFRQDFMATRAEQFLKSLVARVTDGSAGSAEEAAGGEAEAKAAGTAVAAPIVAPAALLDDEAAQLAGGEGAASSSSSDEDSDGEGEGEGDGEGADAGEGEGDAGCDGGAAVVAEEDGTDATTASSQQKAAEPSCPWLDAPDGAHATQGLGRPFTPAVRFIPEAFDASVQAPQCVVNRVVLKCVLDVCRKKSAHAQDDWIDHPSSAEPLVTELQWAILQQCDLFAPNELAEFVEPPPLEVPTSADEQRAFRKLRAKRNREIQAAKREWQTVRAALKGDACMVRLDATGLQLVKQTLGSLRARDAQFDLNGRVPANVWIVKPAGKSRGRGIRSFNDVDKLLEHVGIEKHKEAQWVAQKYIENPLLIARRKFDIRQWVLITDWNPLVIWFMDDCYLR